MHVSIITRTKDRPKFLERALSSIAGQTYQDWDLIIVNDGGLPSQVENRLEASGIADRTTVRHLNPHAGLEAASNMGLDIAQGDCIAIHDDDDTWHPDFLARSTRALAEERDRWERVGGMVCHSTQIDERIIGGRIKQVASRPFNRWLKVIQLRDLAQMNLFPPISFIYLRSCLEQVGRYRTDLPVLGDWDFNLRFMLHYDIGVLPEALANYHFRPRTARGSEGNTFAGNTGIHRRYDTYLRSEYLRQDLEYGTPGLGWLTNQIPKPVSPWDPPPGLFRRLLMCISPRLFAKEND